MTSGAKWLYKKGKDAVMSTPILGDGLSMLGDLWDGISGRGRIEPGAKLFRDASGAVKPDPARAAAMTKKACALGDQRACAAE